MQRISRRHLVKSIAYAGAAMPLIAPRLMRAAPANGKANLAGIGVGGKGWGDIHSTSTGQNVVAICDTDESPQHLGRAADKWPKARRYVDWRKLLEESRDIDGITISTPDHMHAPIAYSAMSLGKHIYLQKPLAHDLHEIRTLTLAARKFGVITQMGIQHHSTIPMRMTMQILKQGVIGKIKEVHTWTEIPADYWPIGKPAPAAAAAPSTLHWDLWLGAAAQRPYAPQIYHPKAWRAWMDLGSGPLGDNGCHMFDPIVASLGLGAVRSVMAETPGVKDNNCPPWSIVRFTFSSTQYASGSTVTVTWYDGKKYPRNIPHLPADLKLPGNGVIWVGENGTCMLPVPPTAPRLYPAERFKDFKFPQLPGNDHYMQWTHTILGKDQCSTPFDYAGPLAETVILGVQATRFPGQELKWNADQLRFENHAPANAHLKREYRKGWGVPGLS